MINKLIKAIQTSNNIAIISHVSPDGDTCGSSLALYRAITLMGKKPYIFCENQLKPELLFLEFSENYNLGDQNLLYDLAISVDCAAFDRLGILQKLFNRAKITANIDHHKTNDRFGDINIIEAGVSATAEVMYKIIYEMNKIKPCLDKSVAKLLYSSIVTDSGGFTFSSVSVQTHSIASKLIEFDINASEICKHFLKNTTLNKFNLKNRTLSNAKFYENNRIAMICFMIKDFEATNTTECDTDGIINNVLNIEGVDVAVAISELPNNSFKCSLRSQDNVDSSRIAMIFGGGGHKNAAGFRLSGYFEDVKERIIKACKDHLD